MGGGADEGRRERPRLRCYVEAPRERVGASRRPRTPRRGRVGADRAHGLRRSAGAEDKHVFARNIKLCPKKRRLKAGVIGVVAAELSAAVDYRIHRANALCVGAHPVEVRYDEALIRYRDVQAVELALGKKFFYLVLGHGHKLVFISSEQLVYYL